MNIKTQENATILVVDDNPKNLQVLLDHLKESGFRTLIARNGEGALRQEGLALRTCTHAEIGQPPTATILRRAPRAATGAIEGAGE